MRSGCCSAMKRRTLSMRKRTELMFQVASRSAIARLADGDGEIRQTVHMAFEPVAALHRADAGGRAAIDEIAGRQRDIAREVGNGLGHRPDELVDIALLADFAIHLEPDRPLRDVPGLARRRDRRA